MVFQDALAFAALFVSKTSELSDVGFSRGCLFDHTLSHKALHIEPQKWMTVGEMV